MVPSPNAVSRATVVVDGQGTILTCNAAAETVFGWLHEEMLNKSISLIICLLPKSRGKTAPTKRTCSRSVVWKRIVAESSHTRVVSSQHKDGMLTPLLLTSSRIMLEQVEIFSLLFEHLPK